MAWTKVDNEILDSLMPEMGDAELRVVLAVNRQTVGRQEDWALISYSLMQQLTGLTRQGASNGIKAAIERKILVRRKSGNSFFYRLIVNEVDQKQSTKQTETVNEVDQSTEQTSQRSRPKTVNEVDRLLVNEVDPYIERKEKKIEGGSPTPQNGYFGMPNKIPEFQAKRQAQVRDYDGIDARLLTELTNEIKNVRGYSLLIENPGTDQLENELRQEAYDCWQVGLDSVEAFKSFGDRWRAYARQRNFDSDKAYKGQFYKFVIQEMSNNGQQSVPKGQPSVAPTPIEVFSEHAGS